MKKTVSIFGATGSIGTSTLDLIDQHPDDFHVIALTAHTDVAGLAAAARRTGARLAVIGDASRYDALKEALRGTNIAVAAGPDGLIEAAGAGADWTMAAIVGCAGLPPVMAAIEAGSTVALANKEALVSAGELMTAAARTHGVRILPVDSEHNAIWQCFDHDAPERVAKIILTASGGPFRTWGREEMRPVSPEQAVKHPNWSMGAKISVDSATMMNKGLELIEAARLFPLPTERIEIVIHPQSVIHSMVEYVDGSVLAQLGTPDMRTPIAYTLAWPDRIETRAERLSLARVGRLDFEAPDDVRFPALRLARQAAEAGGARPAVLNAANEVAVAAFLGRRVGFLDIAAIVEDTLDRYDPPAPQAIEDVFAIDREARHHAEAAMKVIVD